jgi:hypothetical protein
MGFFVYRAFFYDELEEVQRTSNGLVYAGNFAEAMGKIEKYFGDTLINVRVEGLEPSDVFDLSLEDKTPLFDLFVKEKEMN